MIVNDYVAMTPKSRKYAERASRVFPDGISTDTRYFEPYGIFVERAYGTRKWDVDGNEYRDFFGGHGALMLGHGHPRVTGAVQKAAAQGVQFAANHPLELEWAERIRNHIPSVERIRFTASGTEATLLAIRVARAFTGRPKIVRIMGHYHGWHDFAISGYSDFFDGTPAPGVLADIASNTILIPPNDLPALRKAIEDNREVISAVLIEPLGMHFGIVPTDDNFLVEAARIAKENDVLFVLDEVISAFRVGSSGMQGLLGLQPDLTCLGKVAAGGMPGGVLGGSAGVMSVLSRNAQREGGPRSKVLHQGTFTGNPLTASAAIVTIDEIAGNDLCERATRIGALAREQLNEVFSRMNTPWTAYGRFSAFHIFPETSNGSLDDLPWQRFAGRPVSLLQSLRIALNLEGVDIGSRGTGYVSAIHNEDDVSCLCVAFERAIVRLRQDRIVQ